MTRRGVHLTFPLEWIKIWIFFYEIVFFMFQFCLFFKKMCSIFGMIMDGVGSELLDNNLGKVLRDHQAWTCTVVAIQWIRNCGKIWKKLKKTNLEILLNFLRISGVGEIALALLEVTGVRVNFVLANGECELFLLVVTLAGMVCNWLIIEIGAEFVTTRQIFTWMLIGLIASKDSKGGRGANHQQSTND